MAVMQEMRSRARQALVPIIGTLVVGYLSYHMVQGQYGVRAYFQLKTQVSRAEARNQAVAAERAALEARVNLLRPDSLDRDLLDERARIMLNYAHPDDLVIVE